MLSVKLTPLASPRPHLNPTLSNLSTTPIHSSNNRNNNSITSSNGNNRNKPIRHKSNTARNQDLALQATAVALAGSSSHSQDTARLVVPHKCGSSNLRQD